MSGASETEPRLVHVARQAILDARGQVVGYELLYRAHAGDTACVDDDLDAAGARLLADAVLDLRLETITGGRTPFINLTRTLLLSGAATLVRPNAAVFELLEDIAIDDEVVETCRRLRADGYRLALDDFVPGSDAEALLPFASFVKVDVLARDRREVTALARRLADRGLPLVAEKVETRETLEWTREAGCRLFQGYYFCRPQTLSERAMPVNATYIRLLAALNQPTLTMTELEDLVKQDAALSVRVLQCINSAAFAVRREVRSIRDALVLLGMEPIRKWASIWCLARVNTGAPELVTMALMRARACEHVAEDLVEVNGNEMFLVGLCSLLDAMVGRTMAEAVGDLPLSDDARDALLGEPNRLRRVLDAVVAYESGAWDRALGGDIGADEARLPRAYASALTWARELAAVQ